MNWIAAACGTQSRTIPSTRRDSKTMAASGETRRLDDLEIVACKKLANIGAAHRIFRDEQQRFFPGSMDRSMTPKIAVSESWLTSLGMHANAPRAKPRLWFSWPEMT